MLAAGSSIGSERFEVEFVADDGECVRGPLMTHWHLLLRSRGDPVRSFPSYRGQRSFSGWWWFSRSGSHVGYESWLERDILMLLDADTDVVVVVSQPFWLHWTTVDGWRRHAPDFLVRYRDGGVGVVDVRADDRIGAADAEVFAVTERACELVGWHFCRMGVVGAVLTANLRWLSGYRHPRNHVEPAVSRLVSVFAVERELLEGCRAVGDPIAVLPTLFHLLWTGHLGADLAGELLDGRTLVRTRS